MHANINIYYLIVFSCFCNVQSVWCFWYHKKIKYAKLKHWWYCRFDHNYYIMLPLHRAYQLSYITEICRIRCNPMHHRHGALPSCNQVIHNQKFIVVATLRMVRNRWSWSIMLGNAIEAKKSRIGYSRLPMDFFFTGNSTTSNDDHRRNFQVYPSCLWKW